MEVTLGVTNTGAEPFTFTTSFHTYLSVFAASAVTVEGLAGLRYRDAAAGGFEKQEESVRVGFTGEVNRIYFDAPAEARLVEPGSLAQPGSLVIPGRTTLIRKAGFTDTVVWNPGSRNAPSCQTWIRTTTAVLCVSKPPPLACPFTWPPASAGGATVTGDII